MLTNYHTLKHLTEQLRTKISGFTIAEAITQEKDTLFINVENDEEYTLELNATGQGYLFLRPKVERARKNSLDIFPEIFGDKIEDISLYKADRIVEILLNSGKKIIAQFFTSKVNFFITDGDVIISSFKSPKEFVGKNFIYERKDLNFEKVLSDYSFFERLWNEVEAENYVQRLIKAVDTIDSLLAREILHRAGEIETKKIWLAIREVFSELEKPTPSIYYDGSFPKYFSIINLSHVNLKKIVVNDLNEAIRKFVIEAKIGKGFYTEKKSIEQKIKNLIERNERTLGKIESEVLNTDRADTYEKLGSLLMLNLNKMRKGMEEIEVADVFSEGAKAVRIKLDPSLSPQENAERYFEKAKKVKHSLKLAQERIERLKSDVETLRNLFEEISKCDSPDDLKEFKKQNADVLKRFGIIKDKIAQKIGGKFRRFVVNGGFEVWVGKDAKSNDLLTMRFADKNDLWFHARGVGGAHVVLKINTGKGQPSKKAIEQAGSIAAYFSQARTSRLVPVVVTRRKYVRKPRGAPEGTVLVEREEVIMVEPKLPSEEIDL